MDGARLQSLIYKGLGKAAGHIGLPFQGYRPAGAMNPIANANKTALLSASFTTAYSYSKPNTYGQATWQAVLDGSLVAVGDYLVGTPGTFFIAAMQPLLPILAVGCNRVVSISQGAAPVAVAWPASILIESTRGNAQLEDIAGEPSAPHWWMLIPAVPGLALDVADLVTDDQLRSYFITAAELSDLGWRCSIQQTTLLSNSVIKHYQTVISLVGKVLTFRHMATLGGANPARNPVTGSITVKTSASAGASTIDLTAPLGSWFLAAGDQFTLAGHATVYTVQSQNIAASGAFTGVSISPPLAANASATDAATFTWTNDYPVKALVGGYDASMMSNTAIQVADLRVMLSPTGTDSRALPLPATTDQIIIDGIARKVIASKAEYAGPDIAVYDVQAR